MSSTKRSLWRGEMEAGTAFFAVAGEARPDTLSRCVDLIAQLGLVPLHVTMRRVGDVVMLTIGQDELDQHRANILAEKMRGIVSVDKVELIFFSSQAAEHPR